MKKSLPVLIPLLLLLCLFLPARAEETEEADDWTILVYMCGGDLESKYGCATDNLKEISETELYRNVLSTLNGTEIGNTGDFERTSGKVNVLIETGGAKAWHTGELGMKVNTRALQIWRFEPASENAEKSTFTLEAEQPLASMAKPETLSAFIRWGKERFPARKYGIVLWGHGGGSATGIFIDELFHDEYMTLDLLKQAFRDGGVHFEAVLFDACLMANLETACAIEDYANWMIASEEVVTGEGTAIGEWLKELSTRPEMDGRKLGRIIRICIPFVTRCKHTLFEFALFRVRLFSPFRFC